MSAATLAPDPTGALTAVLETIAALATGAIASARAKSETPRDPPGAGGQVPPQSTAGRAKALYAARRRRERAFGPHASLLADPAWDIMLDLFAAHAEDRRVSVSSACVAACVAPTTALRWIASLERRDLIERRPDERDGRRAFLSLSAAGLAIVEQALAG